MLTALVGALIDFVRLLVGWLIWFALWLEASPLGVAWPILLALVLQLLVLLLSIFVWWSRGTVWPIACAYPRTTTGKGPCRNRVLGEWRRCRLHRTTWRRRSDRHLVDPNLRRWQTLWRGQVVEVEHLQGSGFLRSRSELIGVLYYRGFARPPRDVARLLPLLIAEYRRRLGQLREALAQRRQASSSSREVGGAGGSLVLADTIEATRFVVGLLAIGLGFIGVGIALRQRAPTAAASRATLEYSAVFFLYFAVVMFKNGIVGRRADDGVVTPAPDWLRRSWSEAGNTFAVTILLAVATVVVVTVVLPLLTLGAVVLVVLFLAALDSPPRRRRRRRRRS
jgi:hypothetical protein